MTTFTLTNDFHNSTTSIRPVAVGKNRYTISNRAVKRARRALCGSPDCTCGDTFGARGPNPEIEVLDQRADGSLLLEILTAAESAASYSAWIAAGHAYDAAEMAKDDAAYLAANA